MVASNEKGLLLFSAVEAAERFGCSVRTWRTWDRSGRTPAPVRIGRSLYWRPNELSAWVEAGCPDRATWVAQRDD